MLLSKKNVVEYESRQETVKGMKRLRRVSYS
jgi:hypothetical protein